VRARVRPVAEPLGNLNGSWSILFRIVLVLVPVFMGLASAWGKWITSELIEHSKALVEIGANRWTSNDMAQYMLQHQEVHERLPPKHVNDRLERVERMMDEHVIGDRDDAR
jgi:hypothetical protein